MSLNMVVTVVGGFVCFCVFVPKEDCPVYVCEINND